MDDHFKLISKIYFKTGKKRSDHDLNVVRNGPSYEIMKAIAEKYDLLYYSPNALNIIANFGIIVQFPDGYE